MSTHLLSRARRRKIKRVPISSTEAPADLSPGIDPLAQRRCRRERWSIGRPTVCLSPLPRCLSFDSEFRIETPIARLVCRVKPVPRAKVQAQSQPLSLVRTKSRINLSQLHDRVETLNDTRGNTKAAHHPSPNNKQNLLLISVRMQHNPPGLVKTSRG